MTTQSELLEEAIVFAKSLGVAINRGGAVFDWGNNYNDLPKSCDAIGAILLKTGKQDLAKQGFKKGWLKEVYDYLGVNSFWIYRFCIGFDVGHQILIIKTMKDNSEKTEKDDISELGIKLAAKHIG